MKLNTTFLEGVGKDEPIITNANGGKQSKSPSALYLVDANILYNFFDGYYAITAKEGKEEQHDASFMGAKICQYMLNQVNDTHLFMAMYGEYKTRTDIETILTIGKVLQYGAERYSPNNWRLIPREEHLNHALIHLVALLAGDTQDDHKEHAMCRLHMAIATQETKGFSYTEPFKDEA